MYDAISDVELPCHADPELWFGAGKQQRAEAKRQCAECPVIEQCLAEVLEYERLSGGPRWGVFGGLTDKERRKLAGLAVPV